MGIQFHSISLQCFRFHFGYSYLILFLSFNSVPIHQSQLNWFDSISFHSALFFSMHRIAFQTNLLDYIYILLYSALLCFNYFSYCSVLSDSNSSDHPFICFLQFLLFLLFCYFCYFRSKFWYFVIFVIFVFFDLVTISKSKKTNFCFFWYQKFDLIFLLFLFFLISKNKILFLFVFLISKSIK